MLWNYAFIKCSHNKFEKFSKGRKTGASVARKFEIAKFSKKTAACIA
jgi:hypothetical protein